jgi:hypothetical protein
LGAQSGDFGVFLGKIHIFTGKPALVFGDTDLVAASARPLFSPSFTASSSMD